MAENQPFATRSCVLCRAEETQAFMLIKQDGTPHGQEGHAFGHVQLTLALCEICDAGQIELEVHDCFDFEDVYDQYTWYALKAADMAELLNIIAECPAPFDHECRCAVHKMLRSKCERLPTTYWRNSLESTEEHTKRISLGDVVDIEGPAS